MKEFLIVFFTIWFTCSAIHTIKEIATPYYHGLWFLDMVFAPFFIVQDIVFEYKDWKRIMKK